MQYESQQPLHLYGTGGRNTARSDVSKWWLVRAPTALAVTMGEKKAGGHWILSNPKCLSSTGSKPAPVPGPASSPRGGPCQLPPQGTTACFYPRPFCGAATETEARKGLATGGVTRVRAATLCIARYTNPARQPVTGE